MNEETNQIADRPVLRPCPECGTLGGGVYCSSCGEEIEPYLPSVKHYLHELLHEVMALDSRVVRSIPALLFRPGFLTKEYLAGRRKRYLRPARLYLLVAVASFFLIGNTVRNNLLTNQKGKVINMQISGLPADKARNYGSVIALHAAEIVPYIILLTGAPLFAFSLMLFYRRRGLFGQHLIFAFHYTALTLIAVAPGMILNNADLVSPGLLWSWIYLFVAMRRIYPGRGAPLVLRFVLSVMSFAFAITLGAFASVLLAIVYSQLTGELPRGADFII